jgi:inhibitor of KinA sporulation pathway (predicted exonuclease)
MSYVFFDLEWNQGYPRSEADRLDEIIQLGAYRLDSWEDSGTSFSSYVRPSIHKKLHHRVKKMLPLNQKELETAAPFKRVIREFFHWCGENPVFFTWGGCDARVLDMNLCWYGLEEYLDIEIYDLQRAYDLLIAHTDQQASLQDAVEALGISSSLEYHDAGNDAYYTARIGAEMVRRLKRLPTEEELDREEEAFRREKHRRANEEALHGLGECLERGKPQLQQSCGTFQNQEDCLKSRGARVFRCPSCDSLLCCGNWYQVGERYISRSRCAEHGKYYSCLTMTKTPRKGLWKATAEIYDEEGFGSELFRLCKAGGTPVVVMRMPKKRKRFRKKG